MGGCSMIDGHIDDHEERVSTETKAWSVAVGNIDPLSKESRDAVEYISNLDGFIGFFPRYPYGTLCFFETENDAKRARNNMNARGIKTGDNICEFYIGAKGEMKIG